MVDRINATLSFSGRYVMTALLFFSEVFTMNAYKKQDHDYCESVDLERYDEQGFFVCPQVISSDCAESLSESLMKDLFDMAFHKERTPPSPLRIEDRRLFFDRALRERRLDDPNCVYAGGNPRRPLLSYNTGMVNLCLNPDIMRHVQYNPDVYESIAKLYGDRQLVYRHGFDRASIKFSGSANMPLHLDKNLFHDIDDVGYDGRFDRRVQAFVVGRIPQGIPLRDAGTIELIPYFHHYFVFARHFLHPKEGLHPIKDKKNGFHVLGKDFVQALKPLNEAIRLYTPIYHAIADGASKSSLDGPSELVDFAWKYRIPVPQKPYQLAFECVDCEAGDMVCFDQRLPHRNRRNLHEEVERIVFYVRLFPVDKQWYGSDEHREMMRLHVQGIAPGPEHRSNVTEREVLKRDGSFACDEQEVNDLSYLLTGLVPHCG
mgnify:CR=1 FL=1|tara:strand:+ start:4345 stop:5637 length:1293 start_codon:yes stop_codon:yes gene_type:complete